MIRLLKILLIKSFTSSSEREPLTESDKNSCQLFLFIVSISKSSLHALLCLTRIGSCLLRGNIDSCKMLQNTYFIWKH